MKYALFDEIITIDNIEYHNHIVFTSVKKGIKHFQDYCGKNKNKLTVLPTEDLMLDSKTSKLLGVALGESAVVKLYEVQEEKLSENQ